MASLSGTAFLQLPSSQSWAGCAHPSHPSAPVWRMICAAAAMQSCSQESLVIFSSAAKVSVQPPSDHYVYHDLMSPLKNSLAEWSSTSWTLTSTCLKSFWKQFPNLLDYSTQHIHQKYRADAQQEQLALHSFWGIPVSNLFISKCGIKEFIFLHQPKSALKLW